MKMQAKSLSVGNYHMQTGTQGKNIKCFPTFPNPQLDKSYQQRAGNSPMCLVILYFSLWRTG